MKKLLIKNLLMKKLYSQIVVFGMAFFMILSANAAVHLTTYRIYLDSEKRNASFILYNRDVLPQQCKLTLKHNNFTPNGDMVPYKGKELPANSAKPWIRFSPQTFTLTPSNSQTVRFSMRRKAKAVAAEYRSYLSIDCGVAEKPNEVKKMISIKPRMIHNVPIIVRTKSIEAKVSFVNFSFVNGQLSFDMLRSGKRSVYGSLKVIDKSGNKVASSEGIALYPETEKRHFSFFIKDQNPNTLEVSFTENKAYGGSLDTKQQVTLR